MLPSSGVLDPTGRLQVCVKHETSSGFVLNKSYMVTLNKSKYIYEIQGRPINDLLLQVVRWCNRVCFVFW